MYYEHMGLAGLYLEISSMPKDPRCECACRECAQGDHCGESRPLGLGICKAITPEERQAFLDAEYEASRLRREGRS